MEFSDYVETRPHAAALDGTEKVAMSQGGEAVEATTQEIADLAGESGWAVTGTTNVNAPVINTGATDLSILGGTADGTGISVAGSTDSVVLVASGGTTVDIDPSIFQVQGGTSITLTAGAGLTLNATAATLGGEDVDINAGNTGSNKDINLSSPNGHTHITTGAAGILMTTTGPLTINTDTGASGEVLTSNGAGAAPTWEAPSGGAGTWGSITGTLSDQTDLQSALDAQNPIGVQDLFIPASAFWPRTTGGCSVLTQTEMSTSLFNIQSLDFDQTTQEFAQCQIVMPRKWNNGTITAVVYWTATAGSGDVQWGISGGAYSNDDALTVALGTAQTADDTLIATNDLHISPATSAITLAGTPADADFLAIQVSRNPASDTLTADAKFLGVSLRITTDAAKDA